MLYFNERLRQLRKEHNMSQKHLAGLLKIARSTVAGYETGVYKPSLEKLIQLADIFDVSMDYFYINLRMPRAKYEHACRVPVISYIPPNIDLTQELSDLSDTTPLKILYFRTIPPEYCPVCEYFIFAENQNFHLIHIQSTYTAGDTILACAENLPAKLYSSDEISASNNVRQIGIVVDC